MTERFTVPAWALEQRAFIAFSIAGGAVVALAMTVIAKELGNRTGGWLATFFLVVPILVACLLLIGGLRRVAVGPARKQTVPLRWWVMAYGLSRFPFFCALVLLAAGFGLSQVFEWPQHVILFQALALLIAVSLTSTVVFKTIGNAYLLMRHWRQR